MSAVNQRLRLYLRRKWALRLAARIAGFPMPLQVRAAVMNAGLRLAHLVITGKGAKTKSRSLFARGFRIALTPDGLAFLNKGRPVRRLDVGR